MTIMHDGQTDQWHFGVVDVPSGRYGVVFEMTFSDQFDDVRNGGLDDVRILPGMCQKTGQ